MPDPQNPKPTSNLRLLAVVGIVIALFLGWGALLKSIPALNRMPECTDTDTSTRCVAERSADRLEHQRY